MLLLLGTFTLARSIYQAFLNDGLWFLPRHVRTGRLDLYLTKPVNSQFLFTVQQEDFGDLIRSVFGVLIIIYSLRNLGIVITTGQFVVYLLLVLTSVVGFCSVFSIFITLSFWLVDLENIGNFISEIISLGRIPVSVFPKAISFLLTFVIPVAFASMVPAEVLLGRSSWLLVVYGIFLSFTLLYVSHRFWNFALKHYTSAGG